MVLAPRIGGNDTADPDTPRKSKRELYSDPDHKPKLIGMRLDGIPDVLRREKRWVLWKLEWDGKRWSKVPYRAQGHKASSTNPQSWMTFDTAVKLYERGGFDGIGFVLGDGWAGVDLDDVRHRDGKAWRDTEPAGYDLTRRFDGYSDISPSGTGYKIIGKGKWNGGWHKKPFGVGEVEVFDSGRYFCVTGHGSRLPVDVKEFMAGEDVPLLDIQPLLDHVDATYGKSSEAETDTDLDDEQLSDSDNRDYPDCAPLPSKGNSATLTDSEILDRAHRAKNGAKFARLWSGDTSEYGGDDSRADLALCSMLAFWTGNDAGHIDRLFRQSKLLRPKWNEQRGEMTYGQRTIATVLATPGETYTPAPRVTFKPTVADGEPQTGTEITLDYFRERWRPVFRVGNTVHTEDGDTIPATVATTFPTSELLKRLAAATNAPRLRNGDVDTEAIAGKFPRWAKTAWGDLILSLPDEDTANLGADTPTAETFRRLVRDALLTGVTLVETIDKKMNITQRQHLSMIGWCKKFKKPGPWKSIRDYPVWCREREIEGGEIILEVCVRNEVFARLKADRRLCDMTATAWARRAARYGVGRSIEDNRPGGKKAVTLDRQFLAELSSAAPEFHSDDFCPPSDPQPVLSVRGQES